LVISSVTVGFESRPDRKIILQFGGFFVFTALYPFLN